MADTISRAESAHPEQAQNVFADALADLCVCIAHDRPIGPVTLAFLLQGSADPTFRKRLATGLHSCGLITAGDLDAIMSARGMREA